jgi:hypothetical protein
MATALTSLVDYRDCVDRRTLTRRERDILEYTAQGKTQGEIAQILRLTTRQVRRDSQRIIELLAAAAEEYKEKKRSGKLRIGNTLQMGHKAHWRKDKVASKVVMRKGLITA